MTLLMVKNGRVHAENAWWPGVTLCGIGSVFTDHERREGGSGDVTCRNCRRLLA